MDGFIGWLISSSLIVFIGEGLNCYYPHHDGEYENSGMVCQWEQETFYYDEETDEWILKEEEENARQRRYRIGSASAIKTDALSAIKRGGLAVDTVVQSLAGTR